MWPLEGDHRDPVSGVFLCGHRQIEARHHMSKMSRVGNGGMEAMCLLRTAIQRLIEKYVPSYCSLL